MLFAASNHIASNAKQPEICNLPAPERRKIMKPILEKRRRDRINKSLTELKTLILALTDKEEPYGMKMEKADILEMTANYLKTLSKTLLPAKNIQGHTTGKRRNIGNLEDSLNNVGGNNEIIPSSPSRDSLSDSTGSITFDDCINSSFEGNTSIHNNESNTVITDSSKNTSLNYSMDASEYYTYMKLITPPVSQAKDNKLQPSQKLNRAKNQSKSQTANISFNNSFSANMDENKKGNCDDNKTNPPISPYRFPNTDEDIVNDIIKNENSFSKHSHKQHRLKAEKQSYTKAHNKPYAKLGQKTAGVPQASHPNTCNTTNISNHSTDTTTKNMDNCNKKLKNQHHISPAINNSQPIPLSKPQSSTVSTDDQTVNAVVSSLLMLPYARSAHNHQQHQQLLLNFNNITHSNLLSHVSKEPQSSVDLSDNSKFQENNVNTLWYNPMSNPLLDNLHQQMIAASMVWRPW